MTGPSSLRPRPGDFDPSVPVFMSGWMFGVWATSQLKTPSHMGRYGDTSLILHLKASSMSRGGRTPWWTSSASSADDMTYDCDANLGSPSVVDCAQLEYQAGAASDTLQLGPGETKFLSFSE